MLMKLRSISEKAAIDDLLTKVGDFVDMFYHNDYWRGELMPSPLWM